ncbi:hypothetical protein FRUB_07669 [Fimbriiglobus ruber]|uniref:Uncharacterized protein n=1 Tax=Fimbriiglobus ruber TaxID=1908690 RepID=A0A225DMT7_9BACT|nr:hypothetical protein FRUB_07669 [Fimbriiglobus ruber]
MGGKSDEGTQESGLFKKCDQECHRFDCEAWAFYRFIVAFSRKVIR